MNLTPLESGYFTAISAVTVTGHTVVSTPDYWAPFGQIVIFPPDAGRRSGIHGDQHVSAAGAGRPNHHPAEGAYSRADERRRWSQADAGHPVHWQPGHHHSSRCLPDRARIIFFTQINGLDGIGHGKAYWYSLFLSVSSFNNAGFNIIPEAAQGNAARFVSNYTVLITMTDHDRLGRTGLGHHGGRVEAKAFLQVFPGYEAGGGDQPWHFGCGAAGLLALTEFGNFQRPWPVWAGADRVVNSAFLAVSGRTAGFSTVDFSQVADVTKMTFTVLMYIGGAPGSVAGGIKVVTFALIVAAVVSSLRGRSHAEAFGREIQQPQLHRALAVAVTRVGTHLRHRHGAGGDRGRRSLSPLAFRHGGRPRHGRSNDRYRSLIGAWPPSSILMAAMFTGRLGPLVLALAMAPKEDEIEAYRFAQEQVRIG